MKTEERIQKQKALIEEIGKHFDKKGFQPIAGRILGLLMVMDKEQFTFEEITEELNISKSSASNALRNLEIRGNIEYVTIPGDRKRYFQIRRQHSFDIIEEFERNMRLARDMFEKIIELKANKNSENALFFKNISNMINFYLDQIPSLRKKYEKKS